MHQIRIGQYDVNNLVKPERETLCLDISRHTLVTGKSGVGKSVLLGNIGVSLMQHGFGFAGLDPHGDLADYWLQNVPSNRIQDICLVDPLADLVPGLNPFDVSEEDMELAGQGFVSINKSISGEHGWGPEIERVTTAASDAVLNNVKRPTIADIQKFVMRPKFRQRLLDKSHDPLLADFIQQYDVDLRPSERMSKFSSTINKLDKFLRPGIRSLVCQESCLRFRGLMDSNKIIIVRVPKGRLGLAASLIGSIVMVNIFIAALRRKENRSLFPIIADEVQNFTHGVDLPTMLGESRKYGISLVPATQSLAQLGDLRPVFGNCSNLITFRMGGADAAVLEVELGGNVLAEDIVSLPDRVFASSILSGGEPSVHSRIDALPPLKLKRSERAAPSAVRNWSLQRYGKDRKKMDKLIMQSLAA